MPRPRSVLRAAREDSIPCGGRSATASCPITAIGLGWMSWSAAIRNGSRADCGSACDRPRARCCARRSARWATWAKRAGSAFVSRPSPMRPAFPSTWKLLLRTPLPRPSSVSVKATWLKRRPREQPQECGYRGRERHSIARHGTREKRSEIMELELRSAGALSTAICRRLASRSGR